jgi:putative PIN family toxin of toxin-antitoxin system
VSRRIVFDTNTVASALIFTNGSLAWLRRHWLEREFVPLISRAAALELKRVLGYPKFRLAAADCVELLAGYLPYCDVVELTESCPVVCRDVKDQLFLDLAQSGRADVLVTGDQDLLVLAGQTDFVIETPATYRVRVLGGDTGIRPL